MPIAIRLESRDVTKASRGCAHEGFFACGGAPGVFGAAAHGRTDARTHGRTDARTHGRTDARMHGCTDARMRDRSTRPACSVRLGCSARPVRLARHAGGFRMQPIVHSAREPAPRAETPPFFFRSPWPDVET
ncbi:putative transcriptional regulator [Burkholderia pseudomallei MSHR5613]|nr:putative transcriptional regulator [Burkholderia pseudomallei MSHR5613]